MSRLSGLKTASHGPDGKWAYEEILRLRAALEVARGALEWADELSAEGGISGWSLFEFHQKKALAAIDAVLPRSEG